MDQIIGCPNLAQTFRPLRVVSLQAHSTVNIDVQIDMPQIYDTLSYCWIAVVLQVCWIAVVLQFNQKGLPISNMEKDLFLCTSCDIKGRAHTLCVCKMCWCWVICLDVNCLWWQITHFLCCIVVWMTQVGLLRLEPCATGRLFTGQVGYNITGMKSTKLGQIGDSWHDYKRPVELFPGFKPSKSMIFAGKRLFVHHSWFLVMSCKSRQSL